MTACLELDAQLAEVVDLAVERDGNPGLAIAHRLVAALGIDDGEAAMAQQHAFARGCDVARRAAAVGTAVREAVEHAVDDRQDPRACRAPDRARASAPSYSFSLSR